MFLAFDKVQFSQYGWYEQYSQLTPGAASVTTAINILAAAQGADKVIAGFNRELRQVLVKNQSVVPVEFWLFTIRSVAGDSFDVYLLDEDHRFKGVTVEVAEAEVLTAGQELINGLVH